MISKFLNLEPEKRERILNAAISEFAHKGYNNASTNEIVKEAGISKGLLFHYFANKKQLYFFLYDYLMEIMETEYYRNFWMDETDFFEKMRQAALWKLELFRQYPQMFKFFLTAYAETDAEVREEVQSRNQKLLESNVPKIYNNVDLSGLREGIDRQKAMDLMMWALEGYANSKVPQFKSLDENGFENLVAELGTYMEILKKCFFKNENE